MALLHKGSLAEEALGQLVEVVVSCKRNNRRNHKMGHTTLGRHLDMLALRRRSFTVSLVR